MPPLLYRNLRYAGQGFALFLERGGIADYKDFWMWGDRKVTLNAHTTRPIGLDLQPLACRRRCNPRCPDNGPARDTLSRHHDAVSINLIDAASESNLDAQFLEPSLC